MAGGRHAPQAAVNGFIAPRICSTGWSARPRSSEAAKILPAPVGRIEVRGLDVMAPGSERPILSDISFAVNPGEVGRGTASAPVA
jgi:ABC-type transport system involved in cytochrome bd biosynthesis fused ATPase/permease subunit